LIPLREIRKGKISASKGTAKQKMQMISQHLSSVVVREVILNGEGLMPFCRQSKRSNKSRIKIVLHEHYGVSMFCRLFWVVE